MQDETSIISSKAILTQPDGSFEEASGAETFVYTNASLRARKLAKEIQKNLAACGFRNRGVKTANFHVLRETKMLLLLYPFPKMEPQRF